MKTCPNCKKLNENNSIYCSGCGHFLAKPERSRSFRNFIITIFILFSVILMGLLVLLLLNSGLKDLFLQQVATVSYDQRYMDPEEDKAGNQGNAGKSSDDQEKVLSVFGYPEQFIILFDEGADNKRIDSWMYSDMEVCFLFEEGLFIDSDEYYLEGAGPGKYSVNPFDFYYGMTPPEVEEVLGGKGEEILEEATGLDLLIFGNGEIICIFNDMDELIGISKNTLTEDI